MKKLLNTLFVSTQGAYLFKEGESVVVKIEDENKGRFPLHMLDGIVCFGNVMVSPFLMGHCADKSVTISHLTEYGRFLAAVHGPVSGNVLLRRQQYRLADDPAATATIARAMLVGKLANGRAVLRRALRDADSHPETRALENVSGRLAQYIRRLDTTEDIEQLRGIEGEAAAGYFDVFDHLIVAQKEDFQFKDRNRRPPLDPVNALLSFIYTLLMHDCRSALEGVGLDPAVGYLHVDRPCRPSLALDLMEEFRPFLADRLALSLINRQQVKAKDFDRLENGAVTMSDDARKTLLTSWQKRKQEEITHPFTGEKMALGLLPHIQARLLARHIRGDLETYPVFVWK